MTRPRQTPTATGGPRQTPTATGGPRQTASARKGLGRHKARRSAGFTYLLVLWWVAISGVMLMAISQNWVMTRRREREADLLFVVAQYQAALTSYHEHPAQGQPKTWPKQLSDLLEDKRGPRLVRHLRQIWRDPISGQMQWGLVREDNRPDGGIKGVYSLSSHLPVRAPKDVKRYNQWKFLADAPAAPDAPPASAPVNKRSPEPPTMGAT